MANKQQQNYVYEYEAPDGFIYELEGPEDMTVEDMQSIVDGYSISGQTQAEPTAPQQQTAPDLETVVDQKSSQIAYDPEDYQLGMDSFGDASPENTLSLEARDEKIFASMASDPNVPLETLNQFLTSRGKLPYSQTQLEQVAADREAGVQYGRIEYDNPIEHLIDQEALNEEYAPEATNWFAQIKRSVNEAWNDPASLTNYLKRTGRDLGDVYMDKVKEEFPDATPEQLDALEELYIAYDARARSKAAQEGVKGDDTLPWLVGQFLAVEPYDIIPVGRAASAAGKAARFSDRVSRAKQVAETALLGGAVATGGDVAGQALAISEGAQDEFDPIRTLASAGLSTALGGGAEAIAVSLRRGDVDVAADTTASSEPFIKAPASMDRRTKAYKEGMADTVTKIEQVARANMSDWQAAPDLEVLTNFQDLDGVPNTVVGMFSEDGTIRINAESLLRQANKRNVSPDDMVNALMFHEGLGHAALTARYGDELDYHLDRFYTEGSADFQKKVDDWLESHQKSYIGLNPDQRRIRATEEVIAEMAEREGAIPKTLFDTLANFIKDFARRSGYDVKFSDREIRAILASAQRDVRTGNIVHDFGVNTANKNMVVYHGSGADFDKFDHSYMGKGEGVQAFGWGSYFTDIKDIAEDYATRFGDSSVSWKGSKDTWMNVRRKAEIDAQRQGFNEEDLTLLTDAITYHSTTRNPSYEDFRSAWMGDIVPASAEAQLKKVWDFASKNLKTENTGKVYEVDLKDDALWLEWEVPIGDQPALLNGLARQGFDVVSESEWKKLSDLYKEKRNDYTDIQEKLKTAIEQGDELREDSLSFELQAFSPSYFKIKDEYFSTLHRGMEGEQLYRALAEQLGSPREASRVLNEAGVIGNRYVANNIYKKKPRTGNDKFNYVVFDDQEPRITNKYMEEDDKPSLAEMGDIMNANDILTTLLDGYEPTRYSFDELKAMARDRGLSSTQVIKGKGVGELAKRFYQYDAAAMKMSDKVSTLYDKFISDPSPKYKAAYLQEMAKFVELSGRIWDDSAEVARALAVHRTLDFSRRKVSELNEILTEFGGQGHILGEFADDAQFKKFADRIQAMLDEGNVEGAATAARQSLKPYWWQYILTGRHAAMLSGLGTQAKNATDNFLMIFRELEEKFLASLVGVPMRGAIRLTGADVDKGVSGEEIMAHTYGLVKALIDQETYKSTWKAFWEGHGAREYSSKIEMQDARIPVISKVNDALYASDVFFRAFHMNANLHALGVREARDAGFEGMAAFTEGTARAINGESNKFKAARDLTDTALLVDTPSAWSQWAETAKAIKPGMDWGEQTKAFVLNMAFPFLRVTDRLVFQGIRRSPLFFLDKNTRADLVAGGARRDIAIARIAYGSALIAYYWYDDEGVIGQEQVPGPPRGNYRKQASMEATGYRPNSVIEGNRMVDATAVNLSFNPLDKQNNIAAAVRNAKQHMDDPDEQGNAISAAMRGIMTYLGSQSYAENLDNYIAPFTTQGAEQESAIAQLAANQASAFVPAALRQANQQVIDPIKRSSRFGGDTDEVETLPGKIVEGMLGKKVAGTIERRIKSGIPGYSDDLAARIDPLGDEMPQGRTTLSMDNYTEMKQGPLYDELRRLEATTTDPILSGAPTYFTYEGETIRLSADEMEEWGRIQGSWLKEDLQREILTEDYRSLSDEERIERIKEIRKDAYDDTKAELLDEILTARGL